jgi:hypothetical protein
VYEYRQGIDFFIKQCNILSIKRSSQQTKKATKRMKTYWIPVTVLALTIVSYVFFFQQKDEENSKSNEVSITQKGHISIVQPVDRESLSKDWLSAVKDIVEKTNDSQAKEIYEFIQDSALLAEPHESGAKFLQGSRPDQKYYFALVMMKEGDDKVGGNWKGAYSYDTGGANFIPDSQMMILKSHLPTSDIYKGIIFLHEGRHAREFITRRYDGQNPKTFCEEERDTHEFQNRITSKLFGKEYDELVDKLSMELETTLKLEGFSPGEALAPRARPLNEFDTLIPVNSETERNFRDTSIWIHGNFRMLERAFGEKESKDKKALMLFNLYKKNGLLPK